MADQTRYQKETIMDTITAAAIRHGTDRSATTELAAMLDDIRAHTRRPAGGPA